MFPVITMGWKVALLALLGQLLSVQLTLALRTGAPAVACLTLRPLHGLHRARPASASQFFVTQSSLSYEPNQTISVDVATHSTERHFRGFIVQAYDPTTGHQVGTFEGNEEARPISCSASTHRNSAKKQRISLVWVPPPHSALPAETARSQDGSTSSGSSESGSGGGIASWLGLHSPANFSVSMSKRQLIMPGNPLMQPVPGSPLMQPGAMAPPPMILMPGGLPQAGPFNTVLVPGGFQPGAVVGTLPVDPATGVAPVNAFPSANARQVRFRATVVVSYEEFYTGFESSDRSFEKWDYAKKST